MKIDQRMNTNLVTTNLEMSIQDAADLMESSKVHCLPVLDDEWHLELWMLFQIIELPGMKVGDEVTVMLQHTLHHPVIQSFW